MTIEEKAMAYDEALKDMRVIYPNLSGDTKLKLAIEHAFPQLKESKDERIRKHIIDIIKDNAKSKCIPCDAEIAYLEKQKEHQEYCTKFLAKILKHSAEGFRNILKKKGIDYNVHESFWMDTAKTYSKQECNEFYKWMDDMTMELVTEETPEYKKGFKDGLDKAKQESVTTPKFKIGDIISCKHDGRTFEIKSLDMEQCFYHYTEEGRGNSFEYADQNFELVGHNPVHIEWDEEDDQYLLVIKNALDKYERSDKWDANIIFQWLKRKLFSPPHNLSIDGLLNYYCLETALSFMNYLDKNCAVYLIDSECEDIKKAFKMSDWEKILKYAEKYINI